MSHRTSQQLLLFLPVLFVVFHIRLGVAWRIDASCNPFNGQQQIYHAVAEALDVATYGRWRIENDPYRKIRQVTEELVGEDGKENFLSNYKRKVAALYD